MAYRLEIHFEGDVPGLNEHRLSIGAFGGSLNLLLVALRRIATQMVSTAVEGEYPRTGRFAQKAKAIDIELTKVVNSSAGIDGWVTFAQPLDELPLFANLPDRATRELLNSIEAESHGEPVNSAVRKYLRSLPQGLRKQDYVYFNNGAQVRRVEVGKVEISDAPTEFPSLQQFEGNIVGVGFEPGKSEVRVKTDETTASLDATNDQVERAWTMRKDNVRTLSVFDGKRARLLAIKRASEPRIKMTDALVEEHIFRRWNGVFARLAK